MEAQLAKYEISGSAASTVMKKLHAGSQLDADSGAPATGSKVVTADNEEWSVDTWDDGSYFAVSIDGDVVVDPTLPTGPPKTTQPVQPVLNRSIGSGITKCRQASGVGTFPYKNCKVEYAGTNYKGNFRTDFTLCSDTKRWPASFKRADTANYYAVAGTVSSDGQKMPVRIVRKAQSGTTPAMAELTFLWNSTASIGGGSVAIRLNVVGMKAYITHGARSSMSMTHVLY